MSASVEQSNNGALPTTSPQSDDALSELDDGSSSLSDIEEKDPDQDEPDDLNSGDSDNDGDSDANDSEAETERLENSPHNQRIITSVTNPEGRTYERSPSKLQHQFLMEVDDEDLRDVEDASDDEMSIGKSPKSPGADGIDGEPTTTTTSVEDPSGDSKLAAALLEAAASKKRKRSLLPDPGAKDLAEQDEPARKRTGSIGAPEDDYAIDDTASADGEAHTSNSVSGNISEEESVVEGDEGDDDQEHDYQETGVDSIDPASNDNAKARGSDDEYQTGWSKRTSSGNAGRRPDDGSIDHPKEAPLLDAAAHDAAATEEVEDVADADADADADEVAAKNEEEHERKRVALDQLGDIERHFAAFRERLYEERLAQLNAEEAMLKQDKPTHPIYLAMLQAVDARRDETLRISARTRELGLETIKRTAVARRSQILAQYHQEVRDIREKKLEQLGKQWYEIQHDRRGHGSSVEDYTLKFPAKKSQQVMQQIAYNTEVSILSGVAKHVGFPAAPPMVSATPAELDHDFEQMSKSHAKLQSQRVPQALPFPELAALRNVTSTTSYKPAEERFIEQTPWANPHHPSHAHVFQHQALSQQPPRVSSPFSVPQAARKPSHHHISGPPPLGSLEAS